MKKALKATLALALVLSLAFCLTGCDETKKAEKTVDSFFAALKDCDFDTADKYAVVDDEEATDTGSALSTGEYDSEWDALADKLFGSIEYEIRSSEKVSNGEVTVTVKFAVNDMNDFLKAYVQEALTIAFSGLGESQMDEKMADFSDSYDFSKAEGEYDITVKKADGWKVVFDDELQDTVSGGLVSAMAELEESMKTDF